MEPEQESPGSDDLLAAALEEYYDAWFSGKMPDPEEFCRHHPECDARLREEIENFLTTARGLPEPSPSAEVSIADEVDASGQRSRVIGDFRIIREIGRGGMGVVFEAEQISLRRRVALKVLVSHLSLPVDSVLKFRREAEAGARQCHPGIVAVHAAGEQDGVNYIAQELVEGGRTLADRLDEMRRENELPPDYFRETAEIFAAIAAALQHAHDSGVIHRDVKPSNILLTSEGTPKITDFGLAKVEDAVTLSRTGDFAGTPYYMSPEQAGTKRGAIDYRTDIYSLGVTLYEAVTLRRPFVGETTLDVLRMVLGSDPDDPRALNPAVPDALAVICLKAMEKEPRRRFATMTDLAADLRHYLEGEKIKARPPSSTRRTIRWLRRHKRISAAGLAVLTLVLLGAGYVYKAVERGRAFESSMTFARNALAEGKLSDAREHLALAMTHRPDYSAARELYKTVLRRLEGLWLYVPDDVATLGEAIAMAKDGGTIRVAPGVYKENLRLGAKAVTLISDQGSETTTIDGDRKGRVITFDGSAKRDTRLEGFTITNGRAGTGAGILCQGSSPIISDCIIKKNTASEAGGGVSCQEGAAPLIANCTVIENEATDLDSCGGGIHIHQSAPEVLRNVVSGNEAWEGAGIYCNDSTAAICGNWIHRNLALRVGGAIRCAERPPLPLSNNTIVGNGAGYRGGGIECGTSPAPVTNTILWDNWAPRGSQLGFDIYRGSALEVNHCDVEGGWTGETNLDADPLFAAAEDKGCRLSAASPCIDAGSAEISALLAADLEGDPRCWSPSGAPSAIVDIGCDEYVQHEEEERLAPGNPPGGRAVSAADAGESPRSIHVLPPGTIQAAIDTAADGDTILVAAGTYVETIDFKGKTITLRSEAGPDRTIIDGGCSGPVVRFCSGEGPGASLDGFTLTNGKAPFGAGVLCVRSSSPTIQDCVVANNEAICAGGGIFVLRSSPRILGNEIVWNSARTMGGGICCGDQSDVVIEGNRISSNRADKGGGVTCAACRASLSGNEITENEALTDGGGIYCDHPAEVQIEENVVSRNAAAGSYGGGIFIGGGSVTISRNNIRDNRSVKFGGGIHCCWRVTCRIEGNLLARNSSNRGAGIACCAMKDEGGLAVLANNTIVSNDATSTGGGLYCADAAADVFGSILWGSKAPQGPQVFLASAGQVTITYSNIEGGWAGANNMTRDPLFVAAGEGNFHLSPVSPCIDAGSDTLSGLAPTDLDGSPRLVDGNGDSKKLLDMGAYEFTRDAPRGSDRDG
ncbi:MAG: right-handed parallel beta-helix repeat-containing protein [Planctomycetota bacterium]